MGTEVWRAAGATWMWSCALSACMGTHTVAEPSASAGMEGDGSGLDQALVAAVTEHYGAVVLANYQDAVSAAEVLHEAVSVFVASPTANTLGAAREAWLSARPPYLQSEAYRFYDGPIDNPVDGPEGFLNDWPLEELHVDYGKDAPGSGLVNDLDVPIEESALRAQNEFGGEENVATGYHAVEFLLWGQDRDLHGPGNRPHADYWVGPEATAPNGDRRAAYLLTVTRMLVDDLTQVRDRWQADVANNFRAQFHGQDALRQMLTGLIVLSGFELASERLQAALDSGSQEDEQSCFSDNTHVDMQQDVLGLQNVFEGRYLRLDGRELRGPGVYHAVASVNTKLADRLQQEISAARTAADELQPPFDRELASPAGNARIEDLIDALLTVEGSLQEVFSLLGFAVPRPE